MKFLKPSWTKKQFAADCDLSQIVKRFLRTGELPNSVIKQPLPSQDITNTFSDFGELMQNNTELKQAFEALPLEERNKFNNDVESWAIANIKAEAAENPAAENPAAENPAAENPAAENLF